MKKYTPGEIKAILIKKRDTLDESGEKSTHQYCANKELGCRDYYYVQEDDSNVELSDRWVIDENENAFCPECSHCRNCKREIKPQIHAMPNNIYSRTFGGRTFGGICTRCQNKIRAALAGQPGHVTQFHENNANGVEGDKPLKDLKSLSRGGNKLHGYVLLVHDKDPWRKIELGYFLRKQNNQIPNYSDCLVRLFQIGTTCTDRRGKLTQVWKKRRTRVVNSIYNNPIQHSRYMGASYEDNIERAVDYLRAFGYRVIERKDKRNGRATGIPWEQRMSKSAKAFEEAQEALDEKLGEKHAKKIQKIDIKYNMRRPSTGWFDDKI